MVVSNVAGGGHESKGFFYDHLLKSHDQRGLGPSINQALAHIDSLKRWDGADAPLLTVYVQDDIIYSKDWLQTMSSKYLQLQKPLKLGFASGIECVEHPKKSDLGQGMILKDWIRAANMMATHDYWMSMYPISRIDPETGRERGRPNNGMGSGVDWWFVRNHPNSVCRTGRTNLVFPGLLQHAGYAQSTWLARELPESEVDKMKIREFFDRAFQKHLNNGGEPSVKVQYATDQAKKDAIKEYGQEAFDGMMKEGLK